MSSLQLVPSGLDSSSTFGCSLSLLPAALKTLPLIMGNHFGVFIVPSQYSFEGLSAHLFLLVENTSKCKSQGLFLHYQYLAPATTCAHLQAAKQPLWLPPPASHLTISCRVKEFPGKLRLTEELKMISGLRATSPYLFKTGFFLVFRGPVFFWGRCDFSADLFPLNLV